MIRNGANLNMDPGNEWSGQMQPASKGFRERKGRRKLSMHPAALPAPTPPIALNVSKSAGLSVISPFFQPRSVKIKSSS